jgi:penicillin amidase
MSLDLSGNLDLELKRFQLIAEQNLTVDRVNELLPRFDIDAFPTVLSAEDTAPNCTHTESDIYFEGCTQSSGERGFLDNVVRGGFNGAHQQTPSMLMGAEAKRRRRGKTVAGASNNWVVGGNLTQSGKPYLCNDPHLQLLAPSIWILFSIEITSTNQVLWTFLPALRGLAHFSLLHTHCSVSPVRSKGFVNVHHVSWTSDRGRSNICWHSWDRPGAQLAHRVGCHQHRG